jgi:hypothetical protein
MRLARLERQAQGFARPEQMLLADHLVRRARAQLFGQRRMPVLVGDMGKQVLGHGVIVPRGEFAAWRNASMAKRDIGSAGLRCGN